LFLVSGTDIAATYVPSEKLASDHMSSLQNRVDQYLKDQYIGYVSEPSETETVEDLFRMVKKAEEELSAAQERVDRLKWELARVQSQGEHLTQD
jgi:hypothetical protein